VTGRLIQTSGRRVNAFRNHYVLAITRVWVACFSLFIFASGIKAAFWRDAWDDYLDPDPWRWVMVAAEFALSFALAAAATGVSRRWTKVLAAIPLISGLAYWMYALIYQANIEKFQWTFALMTGVVYGIPLVLSLLLTAVHRRNNNFVPAIARLRPNNSLERTCGR
jgi:glucan phosphoethanolaminetransferase (alkaline phosphatase superfamily)